MRVCECFENFIQNSVSPWVNGGATFSNCFLVDSSSWWKFEKTMDLRGAYKQSPTEWTDTDADNIPDIVEIYFSNTTWIDNETLWQEMIVNNGLDGKYGWCRNYYQELNASNSSLAENWTQKAFNPFVYNNMPPMIVSYSVNITLTGQGVEARANISFEYHIRDLRGIAKIEVELTDLWWCNSLASWSISFSQNYYPTEWDFTGYYVCMPGVVTTDGIKLRAVVHNIHWDEASAEWEQPGILSGTAEVIIGALQALIQMLSGGLQKNGRL